MLNPDKIGRHVAEINFEKQVGRIEPRVDEDREELIIEPNHDVIKPKVPGAPDFSKQVGRQERVDLNDDEVYIVDLPENPIPFDPSQPRVRGVPDFAKQPERFDGK